ncbi:MAG: hypothetical protein GC179_02210 [Anaerolineaceae bacterium]|nr:hypothetical protein [Anaerolineaceae bacterium]
MSLLTNPDPDLMQIFDFNAADLEANRAGRLSDGQVEKLSSRKKQGQWLAGIGCAAAAVFILPILVSGLSSSMKDGTTSILTLLVVMSLPVVYVTLGVMDRSADLTRNRPKVYLGKLHIREQYGKFGPSYWISEIDIQISSTAYALFDNYLYLRGNDTTFRLYYAPNSSEVLSLEVVNTK